MPGIGAGIGIAKGSFIIGVPLVYPHALSYTEIQVDWTFVSGATGYRVYVNGAQYGGDLGPGVNFVVINMGVGNACADFQVSALDGVSEGAKSRVINACTDPPPALEAPSGQLIANTAGGGELTVTWTDPLSAIPYGIQVTIYRAADNSPVGGTIVAPGAQTFTTLVSPFEDYYAGLYNVGDGATYGNSTEVFTTAVTAN